MLLNLNQGNVVIQKLIENQKEPLPITTNKIKIILCATYDHVGANAIEADIKL